MHETDIDPKNPQTIFTDLTVVDSIFENLTTDSGEDKPHPFRGTSTVSCLHCLQEDFLYGFMQMAFSSLLQSLNTAGSRRHKSIMYSSIPSNESLHDTSYV